MVVVSRPVWRGPPGPGASRRRRGRFRVSRVVPIQPGRLLPAAEPAEDPGRLADGPVERGRRLGPSSVASRAATPRSYSPPAVGTPPTPGFCVSSHATSAAHPAPAGGPSHRRRRAGRAGRTAPGQGVFGAVEHSSRPALRGGAGPGLERDRAPEEEGGPGCRSGTCDADALGERVLSQGREGHDRPSLEHFSVCVLRHVAGVPDVVPALVGWEPVERLAAQSDAIALGPWHPLADPILNHGEHRLDRVEPRVVRGRADDLGPVAPDEGRPPGGGPPDTEFSESAARPSADAAGRGPGRLKLPGSAPASRPLHQRTGGGEAAAAGAHACATAHPCRRDRAPRGHGLPVPTRLRRFGRRASGPGGRERGGRATTWPRTPSAPAGVAIIPTRVLALLVRVADRATIIARCQLKAGRHGDHYPEAVLGGRDWARRPNQPGLFRRNSTDV